MSNTKKILITLTPLDRFYFGGETGFSQGDREFDETFSSYVVKSNLIPQQTSLLGMMRYLALTTDKKVFDGKRITDQSAANTLIGHRSFQISPDFSVNDFGKINRIGNCFLQKQAADTDGWEDLIFAPMDQGLNVSFDSVRCFRNGKHARTPRIEKEGKNYDPKAGIEEELIGVKSKGKIKNLFCPDVRIGIQRDIKTGKTDDESFYKQTFYRFGNAEKKQEEKVRFAFFAEVAADLNLPDSAHVKLGGDNSTFLLSVEDRSDELRIPETIQQTSSKCRKVTLLSDAYIQEEELQGTLFYINDMVSFRFLSTHTGIVNYHNFKKGQKKEVGRSEKYNLHKRGSVYYFDDEQALQRFTRSLDEKQCFKQIGYNEYITI